MQNEWYPIVDTEGSKGRFATTADDISRVEVVLESGERLMMPRAYVIARADGTYSFEHAFSKLLDVAPGSEFVVPVIAEELSVGKHTVARERVRVRTTVTTRDEVVDVPLTIEELSVERVPVGRVVEATSTPRQDGDTLIVPVYEEVLFVEKRLVLREEVRVTRSRHEAHAPQKVTLRKEEVSVERTEPERTQRTDLSVQSPDSP